MSFASALNLDLNMTVLAGALAIEAGLGYPDRLYRRIGHPVTWIGWVIDRLDGRLNRPAWPSFTRRLAGVLAVLLLLLATIGAAGLLQYQLYAWLDGWISCGILMLSASSLLAQRSLYTHVLAVADGLRQDGLTGGRAAVSHIVGRNPQALDESGIVRAAMESLAENFSDAVVAPAFWCALAGLPGIVFYKSVNTADSMIGHRTARHEAFGWAAARLDDLVNLPASRLAALWIVIAAAMQGSASPQAAWRAVWRDARHHRSPNAGWPEAAMAGALGLRLAGPRVYGTVLVEDGWMGDGRADATPADLDRALALYRRACMVQFVAVLLLLGLIARG
jgi:adenosylcobinamide-phosphate synthase